MVKGEGVLINENKYVYIPVLVQVVLEHVDINVDKINYKQMTFGLEFSYFQYFFKK